MSSPADSGVVGFFFRDFNEVKYDAMRLQISNGIRCGNTGFARK
jgi:hypothetical protein